MSMERIAIMGTGSLGTILGAFIAKSGRQIDLIDANQAHVDALNQNGATVVGFEEFTVPVTALTPDKMEGTYDLFLYMAKQTYNDVAIPQMLAHCHEKTIICTCQNGVPEPEVIKHYPIEKVMGSPIGWGATWLKPGVSRLTSRVKDITGSTLGTVTGEITPEVYEVKEILDCLAPVTISSNLLGLRWNKLLQNATFSGMSAAIGGTFGDVLDTPLALKAVTYIGRETVRACAASGIQMEPFHLSATETLDFTKLFEFSTEEERQQKEKQVAALWERARALEASMLQDLQKGMTKTEILAINGVVCDAGRKFGVPTPVNDMVVAIVQEKEQGKLSVTDAPLDRFVPCFQLTD